MSLKAAERVREIVDELLSTRVSDLVDQAETKRRLQELNSSLDEVQSFARALEGILGRVGSVPATAPRRRGRPARAGKRPAAAPAAAPRRRGRKGPGEFNATPFILATVKESGGKGLRPREIVEKVVTAAPGHHVRPSALVSTILTRLKRKGEVRRRAGKWYPV
jgi:hypothetical protein